MTTKTAKVKILTVALLAAGAMALAPSAANAKTIELTKDDPQVKTFTSDEYDTCYVIKSGANVTFNMNGHKLSRGAEEVEKKSTQTNSSTTKAPAKAPTSGSTGDSCLWEATIAVENGAKLTIVGDGSVGDASAYMDMAIANQGEIAIKGGGAGLSVPNYNYIHNDGKMTVNNATMTEVDNFGLMTINNSIFQRIFNEAITCDDVTESEKSECLELSKSNENFGKGKLIINSGQYHYLYLENDFGDLTINGGTFSSSQINNYGVLTINDGIFRSVTIGSELERYSDENERAIRLRKEGTQTIINGGAFWGEDNSSMLNFCDQSVQLSFTEQPKQSPAKSPNKYTAVSLVDVCNANTKIDINGGMINGTLLEQSSLFNGYPNLTIYGGAFTDNADNNQTVSDRKGKGLEKTQYDRSHITVDGTVTLVNSLTGKPFKSFVRRNSRKFKSFPSISDLNIPDGYVFQGWYKDQALTIPATKIDVKDSTADGIIFYYAKIVKKSSVNSGSSASGTSSVKITAPNSGALKLAF